MGAEKSYGGVTYCRRRGFYPGPAPEILARIFVLLPARKFIAQIQTVKTLIQAVLRIATDRARLVKLEARNAKSGIRKIGCLGIAGIILFTCGYALLIFLGTRVMSAKLDISIEAGLAITAAIHIFAGGLCLLAARARSRRARFFRNTLAEINRDRKWLQDIKEKLKNKH